MALNELSRENPIARALQSYSASIPEEEKQRRIAERKNRMLKSFGGGDATVSTERLPALNVGKPIEVPEAATSAVVPRDTEVPTLSTMRETPSDNLRLALSHVDPKNTGEILMTNAGITGDVQEAREQIQRNRKQQFALSDKYKQSPSGSYDVDGLDVRFAPDTDPEAAKRFLKDPVGGGRGPRTVSAPRPLREIGTDVSELPSKEGMSRHQYQQLLTNKGALDVQRARNLGSLTERNLQSENVIAAQELRNQGILGAQEIKNEQDMAAQEIIQNKAQAKSAQDIKDRNVRRLKERNTLYQERMKNFMGGEEEYATLQESAKKAALEYERVLGSGTVGSADDQAQKYLQ